MSTSVFPGVRIIDMPDLGTVTDTTSFVGERAGSGRFSAVALRNYVQAPVVPQPGGPFLPLTAGPGNALTGPLYLVGDPATPLEAATKQYVDAWLHTYLAGLPASDAGLASGDLFWNGGFLCKKV